MKNRDLGVLFDRDADERDAVRLSVPASTDVAIVAEVVEKIFAAEPGIDRAALYVDGQLAGVMSRHRLAELVEGSFRGIGDADGATLPGVSSRYQVIRFQCRTCGAEERRIHVDPRSAPNCSSGHGAMVLLP
ncbi:hypothetical protein GCM10023170_082660 [Phytohabitans houttuyneae]|uniref:Uncharacterized protein n=1 Tax=Phytohabitans houttuyneae TaxID=1076126 RepID=A0A6V8K9R0_9ACTN|nr:hypothetical protein Phou_061320 [Phytohabitans houttuyneae]